MYMQQLDDIRVRVDVMAADRDQKADTICQLEDQISELQQDNKRYAALNSDLNVRAQGIRTVTVNEKVSSGKRGRPKGQKPSITMRPVNIDREETVDCSVCPDCGSDRLSGITDQYTRVVEHMKVTWETVEHKINRRYCGNCKKQVSAKVPDAMPNARTSADYDAGLTHLNVNGLSHGKIANTSCDVLKHNTSSSSSYRTKIRTCKVLEPDHGSIKKNIMEEPVLNCDELVAAWQDKGGGNNCAGQGFLPDGGGKIQRHPDSDESFAAVRRRCSAGFVYGMDVHWLKPSNVSGTLDSHSQKRSQIQETQLRDNQLLNDLCAILKRLYGADKQRV